MSAYPDLRTHPDARAFDRQDVRICAGPADRQILRISVEIISGTGQHSFDYLMIKDPVVVFAAGMGTLQKTPLNLRLVTMRT